MNLIKLTANRYINPDAVARIDFDPKEQVRGHASFTVVFMSDDLLPLYLQGTDAEDAFKNWTLLDDHHSKNKGPLSTFIKSIAFQVADSGLLDSGLSAKVKNGEDWELDELVTALVICARDCEVASRNDPAQKRFAKACFVGSALSALTLAATSPSKLPE